jgi:hypothetical protein
VDIPEPESWWPLGRVEADDRAGQQGHGRQAFGVSLIRIRSRRHPPSHAPVRSIVQRWRPSRSDGSIIRRAIRGRMPRRVRYARQRRWSEALSPWTLTGRRRRPPVGIRMAGMSSNTASNMVAVAGSDHGAGPGDAHPRSQCRESSPATSRSTAQGPLELADPTLEPIQLGLLGGLLPRVGQRLLPAIQQQLLTPLVVQRLSDLILAAHVRTLRSPRSSARTISACCSVVNCRYLRCSLDHPPGSEERP